MRPTALALVAVVWLADALQVRMSASQQGWREFRKDQIAQQRTHPSPPLPQLASGLSWWVHELAVPEKGCVLLAQPHAVFVEQPHLHRGIVLVLDHDPETEGTIGLLLDRPTNKTIGDLLRRRDELSLRPFGSRPLMIGGDVLKQRRLRVLTSRCDVGDRREIIPGLYECSQEAAARMVATGAASEDEFTFFAAVCQWSPEQMAMELESAIWLPAACSSAPVLEAAYLTRPAEPQPSPDALYFSLIEGIGGEYARQASLSRSSSEQAEWLMTCSQRALPLWARLAREGAAMELDAMAMAVHSALHARDNTSDVWRGLEQLAEQAGYIWFTREVEPMAQRGQEPPLKDASSPLGLSQQPPLPPRRGRGGARRPPKQRSGAQPFGAAVPALRVVGGEADSGAAQPNRWAEAAYSQQNGLLALNMLLFELSRFSPRAAAAYLPARALPHAATSLAEAVRRGGGRVPLLLLCTLYMSVARRLGLGLRLVSVRADVRAPESRGGGWEAAEAIPARGAEAEGGEAAPLFLLQLPGTADQRELYVDVIAEGRLRSTHDLVAFLHPSLRSLPSAKIREFVTPLTHETFCVELLRELEQTCAESGSLAEAAFWRVQLEVYRKQQQQAQEEAEREA